MRRWPGGFHTIEFNERMDGLEDLSRRTGFPIHIWKNSRNCCHGVSPLRSTVARPQTVTALTELKRASVYDRGNSPLLAYKIAENIKGVNVLLDYQLRRMSMIGMATHKKRTWIRKKLSSLFMNRPTDEVLLSTREGKETIGDIRASVRWIAGQRMARRQRSSWGSSVSRLGCKRAEVKQRRGSGLYFSDGRLSSGPSGVNRCFEDAPEQRCNREERATFKGDPPPTAPWYPNTYNKQLLYYLHVYIQQHVTSAQHTVTY